MEKLSIPEYISLDHEYIPGIGKKELKRLLLAGLPGLLVTVVAWIALSDPKKQLITMICGIGYIACCYAVFAKVDKQQSIYTFISRIIRFRRLQKKYYYRQEREVPRFAEEKQK